jgi:CDP-6-deoxy-D-xylo-4-hexulose-3-dehydrase
MNWAGFIVRLRWPYTDLRGGKNRPALVLSGPDERGDLELVMLTSQPGENHALPVSDDDYATDARLPKPSWIRGDRVLKVLADIVDVLEPTVTDSFIRKVRKQIILGDTREYSRLTHTANRPGDDATHAPFTPGETNIPYAGRVFTEDEVEAAVGATLDFWLTLGPEGEAMEKELAAFMGVKHCLLVNSGSSANLVAFSALTTHKLPDHKRIRPGDEVITVAAGFPTTVSPIIQTGAVPVFIDAKTLTGNADCSQLEAAYSPGKTKAVMMAHALGNPFEITTVLAFCQKYDLWLIEDNCDALGCTYSMPVQQAKSLGLDHLLKLAEANGLNGKSGEPPNRESHSTKIPFIENGTLTAFTGTFGDLSTQSFYPPHHLTMGEGGSVNIIRRPPLKTYAESFRDWGRDCWCASGKDDTCGKRFRWQLGELPEGYDHKYIYSHIGFNVKPLDTQAAIGRVQLKRLPHFIEARKQNWERLRRGLHGLEKYIVFALPTHATAWIPPGEHGVNSSSLLVESNKEPATNNEQPITSTFTWDDTGCRTSCSWFGFKITIKEDAPFTRTELAAHLDENKIGNRMLFGGNLVRQPAFVQLRRDNPDSMRVVGKLPNADRIMKQTMFLGTYPGLTPAMIDYMVKIICEFVATREVSKV